MASCTRYSPPRRNAPSATPRLPSVPTRATSLLLAAALLAPALPAQSPTQPPPASATSASQANSAPQATPTPQPKSTTPKDKDKSPNKGSGLITAPAGFDIGARSKDILSHLSAVIRFYRMTATPIQKVGEPSDLLYREQAIAYSSQIANFAFTSAKAEASLIAQIQKIEGSSAPPTSGEGDAQRMQAMRTNVAAQIAALKQQDADLSAAIAKANSKTRPALQQQQERTEGALELQTQMGEALAKAASLTDSSGQTGLAADVDRLQRSAPELADTKTKTVSAPLETLTAAHDAGVSSQASVLFQLLGTRRDIDSWTAENEDLQQQAKDLRTPLIRVLRATIQQGQVLAQQSSSAAFDPAGDSAAPAPPTLTDAPNAPTAPPIAPTLTPAQTLAATRKSFDSLTATFKALSAATVPLTQEIMVLQQNRANLIAWRAAVNAEYLTILHDLLLRVLVIALALGLIFGLGEIWRRATIRYIHDIRRRRQLLVLRRLVIGFLSAIVLIFGLVTQFNSLATFAGFITAGIAVGLQTILLSVAAYFFIIGRYGVRVGDRITVAGVTGDVVEVGLVRFYILELAGSATDLHPTGRIAVFSNSVLFQAGTPLYKQMPGTEYAWHELTVKLATAADFRSAANTMLKSIQAIYETYRSHIERQHADLEAWMDASIESPTIESHLRLVEDGLQFWVRFPVEIRNASDVDEQVTDSLLRLMATDPAVQAAVTAPPIIKGVVKG